MPQPRPPRQRQRRPGEDMLGRERRAWGTTVQRLAPEPTQSGQAPRRGRPTARWRGTDRAQRARFCALLR
eukprot:697096-Alexandrium_andersonii.AAC.1